MSRTIAELEAALTVAQASARLAIEERDAARTAERVRCIDELLERAASHLYMARRNPGVFDIAVELATAAYDFAAYLAIGLDSDDALERFRWPSVSEWSQMAREACGMEAGR